MLVRKRFVALSFTLLLVLFAAPAHAVTITLGLDPALSSLGAESLSGSLHFEVGALPVAGSTSFDVTSVNLTSTGGTNIQLDDGVASPGLGVLDAAGSFLIPTLFVTLDGSTDLTVVDVTGDVVFGAGGSSIKGLSTVFTVASTTVTIVAVPEPATGALIALGLAGLSLARRPKLEGSR